MIRILLYSVNCILSALLTYLICRHAPQLKFIWFGFLAIAWYQLICGLYFIFGSRLICELYFVFGIKYKKNTVFIISHLPLTLALLYSLLYLLR